MGKASPLLAFLADRGSAGNLDAAGWSLLFAEARACGLWSRVAEDIDELPSPTTMPGSLADQVLAAKRQGQGLARDVRRELQFLGRALQAVDAPVILLKGAAYVMADLPAARGRIFSDIDVLVDRRYLAQAESALMLAGWVGSGLDAYDQRYYREWSHEVPPMIHRQRGTTIDLHHSLVMPTCRLRVDSGRMVEAAIPIPGAGNWRRLADEDLILHAASHMLLNSEFDRALRDLGDIDILMRHFGAVSPEFAHRVLARAGEVGLAGVARRAFALCHRFFRTPLPDEAKAGGGPMMALLSCAASTRHPDTRPALQEAADFLLMLRELAIRLPTRLLIRHLLHKATLALEPQARKVA